MNKDFSTEEEFEQWTYSLATDLERWGRECLNAQLAWDIQKITERMREYTDERMKNDNL